MTDLDGAPLPAWDTPEQAFEAWKAATVGRPCDYSGLSYAQLHDVGGIQWPCNESAPNGTERLYTDGVFVTDRARCETFGHDLATGAGVSPAAYSARRVDGRAILKATGYQPAYELPDEQFPLRFTTGRTVYHWHTRTKTRRAAQLQDAAPEMWVELSQQDAARLGISEGDIVQVTSRRGAIQAPARVSHVREGTVFAPWHYGDSGGLVDTAANDLTINAWDPVSKQPEFKVAAVNVHLLRHGDGPAPAPTTTASAPVDTTETGR